LGGLVDPDPNLRGWPTDLTVLHVGDRISRAEERWSIPIRELSRLIRRELAGGGRVAQPELIEKTLRIWVKSHASSGWWQAAR
jgi:hypothetical protein